MTFSFKRITSSGKFIPEIDGLRFIAITGVVLFHLNYYYTANTIQYDRSFFSPVKSILLHGYLCVSLFFVISGFILGMPFARFHILKESPVDLKKYFFRRLTRLEPPYILVMTVMLFVVLLVTRKLTLSGGLENYFSSIFYVHNLIYGKHVFPYLNGPAWSLEIEVQFYILVPLIAYIFSIRSVSLRRILMIGIAYFFLILNYFIDLPFTSLVNYFQYFFIGFLLADLYVTKSFVLPNTKWNQVIGVVCFLLFWFFDPYFTKSKLVKCLAEAMQLASVFCFIYYVVFLKSFKTLSVSLITNIGGMCYSIYLMHYPLIVLVGKPLLHHSFSKYAFINISLYSVILIFTIMAISSVLFLFVERPCMDKNWFRKIFSTNRLRQASPSPSNLRQDR